MPTPIANEAIYSTSEQYGHAPPLMPVPMMLNQFGPAQSFYQAMPPPNPVAVTPMYSHAAAQEYCDYMFNVGFKQGLFSDITVTVPTLEQTMALHCLALSRSPVLYRRLSESTEPSMELNVSPAVSVEGLHHTLGHLYRPLTHQEIVLLLNDKPAVCLEIVDVAEQLEMDLTDFVLNVVSNSLEPANIYFWLNALQPFRAKHWASVFEHRLVVCLCQHLATQLDAFNYEVRSNNTYISSSKLPPFTQNVLDLAQVFAQLPLEFLKRCLGQPDLAAGRDPMQRFEFAKQVMAIRQRQGNDDMSVALRFDNGVINVHVAKKPSIRMTQ
ncbi:uncharacterized protein BYT42DRAFT_614291 [Radiomyces spectabilis]|uniref:uncharacterized protein n=1 Tax=Radiomyces spectabilis TaxID=64574 RepID=UPI00221EE37F|nr:uncharacterized protein BYT42DRAFT_614291 [Radiomyces spectabilis]KAI8377625.1 hypothetical protein BYT42DRAFT_614291 [Radiomyces spectabilis]